MANDENDDHLYELVVGLSVLEDLGLNLYSSIPAVLSEAVANAWDADARTVSIDIDEADKTIAITDNGLGMNLSDVNERYLTVGYRRREEEPVNTPSGRHVMGRKGIGKLSLFSIANEIEVQTVKLDKRGKPVANGKHRFLMRTADIRRCAREQRAYHPIPLDPSGIEIKKGTRIKLSSLVRVPTAATIPALRKRVARRFSVIGKSFKFAVKVQGSEIGVTDRDYFAQLQYLWSIGNVGNQFKRQASGADKHERIVGEIKVGGTTYKVNGWVGTFDEQRSIDEGDNTVVVHAWGKLLHEDLLVEVKAGGLYTKYLIGEIHADFVDLDDKPDMATTDRQHLKEDDVRFKALTSWFRTTVLSTVERSWGEWRREGSMKRALAIDAVRDWYATLSKDNKRFATQLFAKIGKLHLADPETQRELYRNAILAFEKLKLKESLSNIAELPDDPDFEVIKAVFSGIDEIEAVEYHSIAKTRLAVIRTFAKIVDDDAKEKVIQKHIFNHLWLLHPSWERASTNPRIEEAVTREFKNIRLTQAERRGRLDIRYKTAAGKHIIVELKRSGVSVDVNDLTKQIGKYRSALLKCLKSKFPESPRVIEIITVLGKPPTGAGLDDERVRAHLQTWNARYITYDTLIQEGLDSYEDYLEADKRVVKLMEILDRL